MSKLQALFIYYINLKITCFSLNFSQKYTVKKGKRKKMTAQDPLSVAGMLLVNQV